MKYRELHIEGANSAKIVKALASDVRLRILDLLDSEELNIQQLTSALNLGKTTILKHISILEESGFIQTHYVPGTIGNQKVCKKIYDRLVFDFSPKRPDKDRYKEYSISVGNYFNCDVYAPCGLASKNKIIYNWDQPSIFYKNDRVKASLVWMSFGYVEYCLPVDEKWNELEITLEISSQGDIQNHKELGYPQEVDYKQFTSSESDITFWINDYEIGTITVEDYEKGHGGKYTPTWWNGSNYGDLVTINLTNSACTINDRVFDCEAGYNKIINQKILRFRVGIKPDANKISGFNIYGKDFGNYPQDINIKLK